MPAGAGELTLRQRYDGHLDDLPPEVRRRLTEADLLSPAGEIPIEFDQDFEYPTGTVSYQLALGAVGLPDEPDDDLIPIVAAGQARGVVALWLATRGRDSGDVRELTTSPLPGSPDAYDRGALEEGDCSVPAVVWSEQDLVAVRDGRGTAAGRGRPRPRGGLGPLGGPAHEHGRAPRRPRAAPVGPFDDVVARPGNPC